MWPFQQRSAEGGGGGEAALQLKKQLTEKEAELQKLKEDGQRAHNETERLLQLMQMSQEEQFAKDKTIMELQESVQQFESSFNFLSLTWLHAQIREP